MFLKVSKDLIRKPAWTIWTDLFLVVKMARTALCIFSVIFACGFSHGSNSSNSAAMKDRLQVVVGEPTTLSPIGYQNSSNLSISRTGVVAAFYPTPDQGFVYRISKDRGKTWEEAVYPCPEGMLGGACGVGLKEGGVVKSARTL
jgi:hypothetical protein